MALRVTSMSEPLGTPGFLCNDDWRDALWINRACADTDDYTYYRKTFFVSNKKIERAALYISAVHKYGLYLNAQWIGHGPSCHYPQYQYYNAYDITTQLLTNEKNVFAVFTHWFGAGQGRPASARGLILKATIEYEDGTREIVCTDGTWKQTRAECWVLGQPQRNDEGVGYVEKIDAAKIIPGWNVTANVPYAPTFDDSAWEDAMEIGSHPTEPWVGNLQLDESRIVEYEIAPVKITSPQPSPSQGEGAITIFDSLHPTLNAVRDLCKHSIFLIDRARERSLRVKIVMCCEMFGFCMGAILFVASNKLRGWTNIGDEPATYFVIQWNPENKGLTMLHPDRYFSPDPAQREIARALYQHIAHLPLIVRTDMLTRARSPMKIFRSARRRICLSFPTITLFACCIRRAFRGNHSGLRPHPHPLS